MLFPLPTRPEASPHSLPSLCPSICCIYLCSADTHVAIVKKFPVNPPDISTIGVQLNQKMKPKFCAICKQQIDALEEKVMVEKHNVHKRCFNCAICGTSLMAGNCAFDDMIYRYFGPLWFCPAHMMLGSGEKYERLKQKYGDPEAGGGGGAAGQNVPKAGRNG